MDELVVLLVGTIICVALLTLLKNIFLSSIDTFNEKMETLFQEQENEVVEEQIEIELEEVVVEKIEIETTNNEEVMENEETTYQEEVIQVETPSPVLGGFPLAFMVVSIVIVSLAFLYKITKLIGNYLIAFFVVTKEKDNSENFEDFNDCFNKF